ncbi:hypothetical protein GJAV_G00095210 [Gymnothorax javanicus]|nr:hypothetical protein GJAV_G00095210 [Gymnothorax javanicus]
MVLITEDLIRRRAEHNNCQIFSLEEVSLHQQDIEKIEYIDKWCRDLKILYLQNNLIPRIENVSKLKKLEAVCGGLLASTKISGRTGDQTFREDFGGQGLEAVRRRVEEQEKAYRERRAREKQEALETQKNQEQQKSLKVTEENKENLGNPEEESSNQGRCTDDLDQEFWDKPCAFTPESRLETHRHMEEKRRAEDRQREKGKKVKVPRTLITAEGRILNVNEPKLEFYLSEDEETNAIILDLAVYRHMDTSLLDVDVQPTHIRVEVKGKTFQLVLPAEVRPDSSTAKRSQTTGHLLVTMPKVHGEVKSKKPAAPVSKSGQRRELPAEKTRKTTGHETLEVDPGKRSCIDLANIVQREKDVSQGPSKLQEALPLGASCHSEDFEDNPDVPPLI